MEQVLLIDKPKDWTSFDVVAKIRNAARVKYGKKMKVGHTGTLDPFATGLLIILVGQATKKQDEFMKLDKEYEATIKLGYTSTTGDPEGEITACHSEFISESGEILKQVQNVEIKKILNKFTGEIEQTPHSFSAIKINGKRAYQLAREGQEVKIEPRKVTIYELEILKFEFSELTVRVKCSSGTYIRSLAEDIGKELGCGAYLTELRRTKIGKYNIEDAKTVQESINNIDILA